MTTDTSKPSPRRSDVGLRSERGPILLAVMLGMTLIALDATILATAVPSVVRTLGGFSQFPWLFSIYVLGQAVSVPIYGKLADQFGRKPIMLTGIAIFLLGSLFCGLAWSMPVLIAFRAVQGLGAGAIAPTAMTIVGDLYSIAERAKVQGYLASVWGISSVLGPTLGGVFTDYVSWRAIFFINLPVGGLAAGMLVRRFHESMARSSHRIDFAGAGLLAGSAALVILGLLEGDVLWPWLSAPSMVIFAAGAALLLVFVAVERRAAEPVLPGWAFRGRIYVGGYIASTMVGALTLGLSTYIPTFGQDVLGATALLAGFSLAAMTLCWPVASSMSGRIYLRIGFRNTSLIGAMFAICGTGSLLLLDKDSTLIQVGISCAIIGLGLGLIASPTMVALQSVVDWSRRGVVTGTFQFSRTLGSAIGTAVFGALANARLDGHQLGQQAAGGSAKLPAGQLADAIHQVFTGALVAAVIMIIAIAIIPGRISTADQT